MRLRQRLPRSLRRLLTDTNNDKDNDTENNSQLLLSPEVADDRGLRAAHEPAPAVVARDRRAAVDEREVAEARGLDLTAMAIRKNVTDMTNRATRNTTEGEGRWRHRAVDADAVELNE